MAVSDIPEFVRAQPGDLIRSGDWNNVQHLMRASLRTHQHTRIPGQPPVDTATVDVADQISTAEIADGAITLQKMAAGSVGTASLPDGAVTTPKLADGAVTGVKIGPAAVSASKLSFQTINAAGLALNPGASIEVLVQASAPSTKTTIYFPTLAITSSAGSGNSDVTAQIVYRQAVGATTIDVYLRLANAGAATAQIIWQVLTFSQ